jgi:hypothetical protein
MKPGQKPLTHAVAVIAGLQAMHPDPTVNASGEMLNGCICEMLNEILGEPAAAELMEAVIAELGPQLESQFGIKIVTMSSLAKQAETLTDDLVAKLRKGGL